MTARRGTDRDTGARRVAKGRGSADKRRRELTAAVAMDLKALQRSLREMVSRYELRVGGQIAELLQALEGDDALSTPPRLLSIKIAQAMSAAVAEADLKPRKGRAKDFARLQALVAALTELSPPDGA